MLESKGERSSLSELNQDSEWVEDGRGGQSWWRGEGTDLTESHECAA